MKQLWLVDVDGTVINKEEMWRQLEEVFRQTFPRITASFQAYYNQHKGDPSSVERVMQAMVEEFGVEEEVFMSMFDLVDYRACFNHEGWWRLTEEAQREGAELAFFTQGTRWVQEAKQRQLNQITGELPWYICEGDKMDELPTLVTTCQEQGVRVTRLIDDTEINRQRAEQECGLRTAERL